MAFKQRFFFLSKRFSNISGHVYLDRTYRGPALLEQHVMKFSTVGSSKFYLFNYSGVKNFERPARQLCAVAKNEILEIKETQDVKNLPTVKSIRDINFSDPDVMKTFRGLLQVYLANKYNRSSISGNEFQELVTSDECKNYWNSLEKKLPVLSAEELKLLLRCTHFQIPASSVLLQKIYHLIIEKINDYNPVEIVSIYVTIKSASHKENLKSKVLQLICEQYFKSKIFYDIYSSHDYKNIAFLCKFGEIPFSVRKKLFATLAKNFKTAAHDGLTLNTLCQIFGAFAVKQFLPYFEPEMYEMLKARITEKPTFIQMRNILIGLGHLIPNQLSYDERFLDILVEQTLEKELSNWAMAELIIRFFEVEYLPLPLVKNLEKSIADPNFTLESTKLGLRLAKILSIAYYHPLGYSGNDSNHTECIKKLESLNFELDIKTYVKWCLYLTVLGSDRKIERLNELFNYLMNTYRIIETTVKLEESTAEAIITLHAFARKNFPDDVVELSETFLKTCYDALKTDFIKSVHQVIYKLLEANAAVEYCTTSMYHFIDFAMLLNEKNESQKITSDLKSTFSESVLRIEDINKPPLSKLILYQLYRGVDSYQFKNSLTLPGTVQLYLQSLETSDCRVLFFYNKKLKTLDSKHQMSYLVANINENLEQEIN